MVIGRYLLRISTYFKKSKVYSAGLKLLAPCLSSTSFMKLSFPSSIKGTDRKTPPTLVIFFILVQFDIEYTVVHMFSWRKTMHWNVLFHRVESRQHFYMVAIILLIFIGQWWLLFTSSFIERSSISVVLAGRLYLNCQFAFMMQCLCK